MSDAIAVSKKGSKRLPLTYVVAVVPVAAALNIVGGYINTVLKLPIFLDMIGTMVTAVVLGPWWRSLFRDGSCCHFYYLCHPQKTRWRGDADGGAAGIDA